MGIGTEEGWLGVCRHWTLKDKIEMIFMGGRQMRSYGLRDVSRTGLV